MEKQDENQDEKETGRTVDLSATYLHDVNQGLIMVFESRELAVARIQYACLAIRELSVFTPRSTIHGPWSTLPLEPFKLRLLSCGVVVPISWLAIGSNHANLKGAPNAQSATINIIHMRLSCAGRWMSV